MVVSRFDKEQILDILATIPDPEIPVVNILEMGMVKDVVIGDDGYEVIITPTYSGCPAVGMITADIRSTLEAKGVVPTTVRMVYDPAWTTDWMTDVAKKKLHDYGIAPPLHSSCNDEMLDNNTITCPRCGSERTHLLSRFGSTACKALYKCDACLEPFEYFKCH
ncbi:phenylacetate-CoA oxygenase subunit PaaJ [Flavipsychrobacter stenotrophus]|uniref:Phenylacetate-CoA oxygenase subunit PaaJ n=1 Tax=Flavipsychrobacter stenotrophus TaxID=2077091 RepID=A0A2S7SXK5_9BACT|nr:1,2-phenylacetyl-CoA epoxidase subunit PaaD [Flavipsychrobacter stenotrophus]PQJ11337.1 phenylacetate-CoA oxygenase subunit PaaJ [Flavipsychrobacter stenotrophus]